MIQSNKATGISSLPAAFFAMINDVAACEQAIGEIQRASHFEANHLQFFRQTIEGDEVIIAILDLNVEICETPIDSWKKITESLSLKRNFATLQQSLSPHSRGSCKFPWVKAEVICNIRPSYLKKDRSTVTWHAAVTSLKVEKEAEYRLLHNNVWPGVIDAIGDSNISRFDIFLIEFGENKPYLFYRFQYAGCDYAEDIKAQSDSPINQRWWKYTDACQQSLPEAPEGSQWLEMKEI